MTLHSFSTGLAPGYEFGYDQITAGVNIASTTEATPTTLITCAAHTFDGALVLAEIFFPYVETGTVAGSRVSISLMESTTEITRLSALITPTGANMYAPHLLHYRFTPTAGSHTYTVSGFATSTTGTPSIGAGAGGIDYPPAFIRFTKV